MKYALIPVLEKVDAFFERNEYDDYTREDFIHECDFFDHEEAIGLLWDIYNTNKGKSHASVSSTGD